MQNRSNYVNDAIARKKLKTGLILIGDFLLWAFTSIYLGNLAVFVCGLLMVGVTILVGFFLPNERESTCKSFMPWMAGYCATLLVMKFIILAIEASSSTDAIVNASGINFLTGMYSFVIFMLPIGFITWQAKKFINLGGIGKSKRQTMEYYKDHGNDGMM